MDLPKSNPTLKHLQWLLHGYFKVVILFGWLAPISSKSVNMKIVRVVRERLYYISSFSPPYSPQKSFPIFSVLKALKLKVCLSVLLCKVITDPVLWFTCKLHLNIHFSFLLEDGDQRESTTSSFFINTGPRIIKYVSQDALCLLSSLLLLSGLRWQCFIAIFN